MVPLSENERPTLFSDPSITRIVAATGGYPYFIQFVCREIFDLSLQGNSSEIPLDEIVAKLDVDFFSGRWAKATDRQRDLLKIIALLEPYEAEFTVLAIVAASRATNAKPFSSSHVNQMLTTLQDAGLVYKNRHGKYLFAVPLLAQFIRRQMAIDRASQGL